MTKLNLKPLVDKILKILSARNGSILVLRHGVEGGEKYTLERIGKKYGITRERVRQIEEASYEKIRNAGVYKELTPTYSVIEEFLNSFGGVVTEKYLINNIASVSQAHHVSLLLALNNKFVRIPENDKFETIWASSSQKADAMCSMLNNVVKGFKKVGKPVSFEELKEIIKQENLNVLSISENNLPVTLAVSKQIQKGPFNKWGLSNWPQINPRGVRDRAHLIMEKHGQPLHFRELAKKIDEYLYPRENKKTHPQTAHNELIKDDRFVLIGRGTYALADWGYVPGAVKDVIMHILQEHGKPMDKRELLSRVMKQRRVQENTIVLNLQNRSLFKKEGTKYYLA
ncbi:MAG: hypothetical protein A3H51_03030 [Candidatus Spechtbacteria bacterium RIFCSPLOWO2_02_FULL_38_8]|uniref:HTH HARE-type domain-containing protein n=1 Tax=Candidatus Spechtbacteria bacterium RIFCSPLOWO2_02_FULL_38_8 TaxID=1802164 RepID=A0A1G2HG24_9BACT|nr:MAG: hypothetical protein A3H51_03030 [Candidatus Spechtbacteria bacterium RIFCSPLOWO2_02_FULL_38_8]